MNFGPGKAIRQHDTKTAQPPSLASRLVAQIDVSRQPVNAIQTGKRDPSLVLAFRIARLFGIAAEEVFLMENPD